MPNTRDTDKSIPLDQPLVNGLTPAEIFTSCVEGFNFGTAHQESWIERFGEPEWDAEFVNERTEQTCTIGAFFEMLEDESEDADEDDYTVLRYVVELKLADTEYVSVMWEAHNAGPAYAEFMRQCAHKTLIKMSAVIGVKVGYELMQDPSEY